MLDPSHSAVDIGVASYALPSGPLARLETAVDAECLPMASRILVLHGRRCGCKFHSCEQREQSLLVRTQGQIHAGVGPARP